MFLIFLSAVPLTLLLYCPIMTIVSAVTPWKGFRTALVRHRKKHYTTLHLSTFDRVGHLNLRRAARFHRSFLATLHLALQRDSTPVYFTSHLMRPAHLKSMTILMSKWGNAPLALHHSHDTSSHQKRDTAANIFTGMALDNRT